MARKHALLSASGAERWLNCTPSARLEEKIKDTSSPYAAEGTLAHNIAEYQLQLALKQITKRKYNAELKKLEESEFFYPGMVEEVEEYTNYCLEQYAEATAKDQHAILNIEERLDFSKYVPEGYGTGDCVIVGNGELEVIDLKFGKGVVVSPVENSQLMLYALGAWENYNFLYDIEKISVTVAQVRLGNISSYSVTADMLLEWGEEIRPKANLAFAGKGDFAPGHWCRWCKVKATCTARAEYNLGFVEQYSCEDPRLLELSDIPYILERESEISSWLKDVKEYALEEALKGVKFEGWKLVEGRSNRVIYDTEGLAKKLLAEGYAEEGIYKPKTLEGITNLERLVGKKRFIEIAGDLISKPPGKPVLVEESDKRTELNSAEEDFF